MLKVLYIAPIALKKGHGAGGVETAVENTLNALSNKNDIKIIVLSFRRENFDSFDTKFSDNISIFQRSLKYRFQFLDIILYQRNTIKTILQKEKPDIIHFHGTGPSLLSLLGIPKDKIVITQHGINKIEKSYQISLINKIKFSYKSIIETILFKTFTNFIFISKNNYSKSKQLYKTSFTNYDIIPNTISSHFYEINQKHRTSNTLLYVGFISRLKNILLLIKVIKRLRDENKTFILKIVGSIKEKEYYDECIQYISRHKLSNQILFMGFLNQIDLVKLYDDIDIFVLPSMQENSPISILEALAAGRIVVSSNVGGIPELISDGENGFLFESNEFDELYRILDNLYNNNNLISKMSEYSKSYIINNSNPEIIANKLVNFYKSIKYVK